MPIIKRKSGQLICIGLVMGTVAIWILTDPVYQDQAYHNFADQRTWFGIPNTFDVLSNLGLFVSGVWGLFTLKQLSTADPNLSTLYRAFFAAIVLVGLGSAWYHLDPDDQRLIWDRLPMAIAFMAFTSIILYERLDRTIGRRSFSFLLTAGIASILVWIVTGDLRLYLLVQFGPMLLLPVVIWHCPGPGTRWLWLTIACYVLAKVTEHADAAVFEATGEMISGHTLKHIAAALGVVFLIAKVREY